MKTKKLKETIHKLMKKPVPKNMLLEILSETDVWSGEKLIQFYYDPDTDPKLTYLCVRDLGPHPEEGAGCILLATVTYKAMKGIVLGSMKAPVHTPVTFYDLVHKPAQNRLINAELDAVKQHG